MTRRLFVRLASLCAAGLSLGLSPFRKAERLVAGARVAHLNDGAWHSLVVSRQTSGDCAFYVDGQAADVVHGIPNIIGAWLPPAPGNTVGCRVRASEAADLALWDEPGGGWSLRLRMPKPEIVGVLPGSAA